MSASDAAAGASASTPADPCWPEPFREIKCHGHPGPELCCDENHGVDDNEEDDDASGEAMQVMPGDQEDIGQVAVILRLLSGSNPIQAMVDPDATVGQLKAKLKLQLKYDAYNQYVQRKIALQGGRPRSWSLRDDYDKFMATKDIREVLEAQSIIEFALVLGPAGAK